MLLLPLLSLLSPASSVTLEEAWRAAEQNNVDLGILHEQTVQAETLRGQAWALYQPKVVAQAHYTVNEYEIVFDLAEMLPENLQPMLEGVEPAVFQEKEYFDANVSVIQPILNARAVPTIAAAYSVADGTRRQEEATRLQVRAGIARAYWGVVVSREGVKVAEEALANAEAHRKLAGQQVAAGVAAPMATLRGDIAVARAERELMTAREGATAASLALATATGFPSDVPVEAPAAPTLPFADVDTAVGRAIQAHPALAAADATARAARLQRLAAHLDWVPTVDGRFTYNYTENTGGFTDDPTLWQVVFTASWTIWDGGFRVASLRDAESVARMAGLNIERVRLQVEQQVRTLWETHARAEAALRTVERERELATENLRLAEAAYAAGTLTWLELEDARLGLKAARIAWLKQRMDRDLAALDLLAAVGVP